MTKVWEVGGYDPKLKTTTFVVADNIGIVKQHFYIGSGGFIRERPDVEITPDMRVLYRVSTEADKEFRATIAAMILQGILSNHDSGVEKYDPFVAAKTATKYADALIAELNKKTSNE